MFLYGFSELPIVFKGCLTTCLDLSESCLCLLQYFRILFELDDYLSQVDIQVFCCTNGRAPLFFPYVPRYSFFNWFVFHGKLEDSPRRIRLLVFFGSKVINVRKFRFNHRTRWWFRIFFIFTPTWGRFPFWLYNIFQLGWNHQLEEFLVQRYKALVCL